MRYPFENPRGCPLPAVARTTDLFRTFLKSTRFSPRAVAHAAEMFRTVNRSLRVFDRAGSLALFTSEFFALKRRLKIFPKSRRCREHITPAVCQQSRFAHRVTFHQRFAVLDREFGRRIFLQRRSLKSLIYITPSAKPLARCHQTLKRNA